MPENTEEQKLKSLEELFKQLEDYKKNRPIRYFLERCYCVPVNKLRNFRDSIKYLYQRLVRGYDDLAKWNIGVHVIQKTLPMLRDYRKNLYGFPGSLETLEEWEAILDTIVYGFELVDLEEKGLRNWQKEDQKHIDEACLLFGRWLTNLWT